MALYEMQRVNIRAVVAGLLINWLTKGEYLKVLARLFVRETELIGKD